jgi:hypothetical protein
MRRLVVTATAALLALAPVSIRPHGQGVDHVVGVTHPVFGPSVHLLDPSLYPASDAHYPLQPLPDAEPSIAIAPDGTVWVAAIHMHDGTALWRGRFGHRRPAFVGMPDHGLGGFDVALALGVGAPANLYIASLVPLTGPVVASRVAATACPAGVVDADFRACAFYPHLADGQRDRPWLAAYGPSTVYLSYTRRDENVLSGHVSVERSPDGGRTWHSVGDPTADLAADTAAPVHGWPGDLVVDGRGAVYEVFVTEGAGQPSDQRFNRIMVASSDDGGVTWRAVTVYHGGAHEDDGNMWPDLAVDAAGSLYAAWSDRRDVYLARSDDGGATWTAPRRVDRPSPLLRTSVLPALAAGAAGHVALAWYGTAAANNLAVVARWRVWFAESHDGGRAFAQVPTTGAVHRGPVCTKGDSCPWVQRQLLDDFGLALDPRTGRAAIAYSRSVEFGDYLGCRRAANCPQTYYVEELPRRVAISRQ